MEKSTAPQATTSPMMKWMKLAKSRSPRAMRRPGRVRRRAPTLASSHGVCSRVPIQVVRFFPEPISDVRIR